MKSGAKVVILMGSDSDHPVLREAEDLLGKMACLVMGSWSINEVITKDPIVDPTIFMTTIFAEADWFITIEGSATSATNLERFVSQCCGDER